MPTELVDQTSQRVGEEQHGLFNLCYLKHYYTGTVCFPAAPEFGCGTEKEVGKAKEESLELKIGAESEGVGVDLTIGTKTTDSEKWTITSKDCEWCKPEICFPDSTIEVWTCSSVWTWYTHEYDKTCFHPGSRTQSLSNCGPDLDRHCGCKEESVSSVSSQSEGRESGARAMRAMLITPIRLVRVDQQSKSNPEQAADHFAALYEQEVENPRLVDEPFAIGVRGRGNGVNWLYPASDSDPLALSLLSSGPVEKGFFSFHGRFLPILAATRRTKNAKATIRATVTQPFPPRKQADGAPIDLTSAPEEFAAEAQIRTGGFTLIWAELDFGRPLERWSNVSLLVKLTTLDNHELAYGSWTYKAL